MINIFIKSICIALITGLASVHAESVAPLPVMDSKIHQGVATCAGSQCHGSVREFKQSNILHNEYITWDRKDAHSQAYNKLFGKDFVAITDKLGLKAPHEEPVCLACHASSIPEDRRGAKFQLADGIGCESCHGGSEDWLASHTNQQATHADNVANGLYPLDDIVARAKLCLSCHYGNNEQFGSHDIMGAGHPRISFELDTFTELQPKHFVQDQDYGKRKQAWSSVKAWAVGQAMASAAMLDMIMSDGLEGRGLFPELSLFDCHSCHHPMSDKSWTPRKGTGLKPGDVPINDASLLMLRHVVTAVNKTRGWQLKKQALALQASASESRWLLRKQASELQTSLPSILTSIIEHEFSAQDIAAITRNLLNEGIWEGYSDYIAAEQCVMALSVLTISWDQLQPLQATTRQAVSSEIDRMYELVQDDEAYQPNVFRESLLSMRSSLGLVSKQ